MKRTHIFIAVLLTIGIAISVVYSNIVRPTGSQRTTQVTPNATLSEACSDIATIQVANTPYEICVRGETTVLDAMRNAEAKGLSFTGKEYPSLGFFVDSINGKASSGGYYWFLYINDKSSSTGASQSLVHPGDVVEWRYQDSY